MCITSSDPQQIEFLRKGNRLLIEMSQRDLRVEDLNNVEQTLISKAIGARRFRLHFEGDQMGVEHSRDRPDLEPGGRTPPGDTPKGIRSVSNNPSNSPGPVRNSSPTITRLGTATSAAVREHHSSSSDR